MMRPCCLDNNHRNGQSQFSLDTECIALKCMYLLFVFFFIVRLQITHVCIGLSVYVRSFICSVDHLTRTSAANFFSLSRSICFLLGSGVAAAVAVVHSDCLMWSILVRWSIEFRCLGSKNHTREREQKILKWCELYARVSIIFVSFFILVGQFKRRHSIEELPFMCVVLSVNDNYVFDEIYNFEELTFR